MLRLGLFETRAAVAEIYSAEQQDSGVDGLTHSTLVYSILQLLAKCGIGDARPILVETRDPLLRRHERKHD